MLITLGAKRVKLPLANNLVPVAVTESWTATIERLKQKQIYGTVHWGKCYRVAKRQPMRHEATQLQTAMVIHLWF